MKHDRIVDFNDERQRRRVVEGLSSMRGKWRIEIKRYRKRRSDAQNAYYWGVLVSEIRSGLEEVWGERLSADEVHEYLKSMFLTKPIVDRRSGDLVGTRPGSTAKLDVNEFVEFVDKVIIWAAEYLSVDVPTPHIHGIGNAV